MLHRCAHLQQSCEVDRGALIVRPTGGCTSEPNTIKNGRSHWVPATPECREQLIAHLERVPPTPDAWLFRSKHDASRPVDVFRMSRLLRSAYERAGLETLEGGLWHPWRRKWATERKDMPLRDVAEAGGWRDPNTLLVCRREGRSDRTPPRPLAEDSSTRCEYSRRRTSQFQGGCVRARHVRDPAPTVANDAEYRRYRIARWRGVAALHQMANGSIRLVGDPKLRDPDDHRLSQKGGYHRWPECPTQSRVDLLRSPHAQSQEAVPCGLPSSTLGGGVPRRRTW